MEFGMLEFELAKADFEETFGITLDNPVVMCDNEDELPY